MFGPKVDPSTLLLCISALGFVMAAIGTSAARTMPAYRPSLRAWSVAMLGTGLGFFLFYARGYLPLFLTFVVGNALVMLTASIGLLAHCRLLGVQLPAVVYLVPMIVGLVGVVATYALGAPHAVGVGAVSAALAVPFGITAVVLARAAMERLRLLAVVSTAMLGLLSAALVLRVFISAFGDPASIAAGSTAAPQVGMFLLGSVYLMTGSLWIFDTVHERQRREMLEVARRDGLTGLYTRTAFFEVASSLIGKPGCTSCAVVMADVDHFKSINDKLGHAAGDTTLAHAARLIAGAVRLSDVVGRYGGEEFCILLPGCTAAQAGELADRLVREAAGQKVRHKDGRQIEYTLSAGYAAVDAAAASDNPASVLDTLLERADEALYRAKNQGRNHAVAAAALGSQESLRPASGALVGAA